MTVLTTLELEYVVRGYHECKRVCTAVLDELLSTEIESGNPNDKHAVVECSDRCHGTTRVTATLSLFRTRPEKIYPASGACFGEEKIIFGALWAP